MKAQRFAAVLGGALLLAAQPALAGPALPDPPFVDGGFVPDTSGEQRIEQNASKAVSNLINRVSKCTEKAVTADFKGESGVAIDLADCREKALDQYQRALGRLSLPSCLTPALQQSLATDAIAYLDGVADEVFCDGPASAATGLNTPPNRASLMGQAGIWKALAKALPAARKCFDNTVKAIFKGDANYESAHTQCKQKAQLAYEAIAGRLIGQGSVPACNPPANVANLGLNAVYVESRTTTGETYCNP